MSVLARYDGLMMIQRYPSLHRFEPFILITVAILTRRHIIEHLRMFVERRINKPECTLTSAQAIFIDAIDESSPYGRCGRGTCA